MDTTPIEKVRRRLDIIQCDPYKARLTAGACIERQRKALDGPDRELIRRGVQITDVGNCLKCEVGKRVAEQVVDPPMQKYAPKVIPPPVCGPRFLKKVKTAIDEGQAQSGERVGPRQRKKDAGHRRGMAKSTR